MASRKLKYVLYKTYDPQTGEFYIGRHSYKYCFGDYSGSGSWPYSKKQKGHKLKTKVIATCLDEEAWIIGEKLFIKMYKDEPLCRNIQHRLNVNSDIPWRYG